ncbi:hypothetical protein KM043_013037 [Ampulex compressa]|nr:hypothetical protein KM043_013037 [Ampulex compressa]
MQSTIIQPRISAFNIHASSELSYQHFLVLVTTKIPPRGSKAPEATDEGRNRIQCLPAQLRAVANNELIRPSPKECLTKRTRTSRCTLLHGELAHRAEGTRNAAAVEEENPGNTCCGSGRTCSWLEARDPNDDKMECRPVGGNSRPGISGSRKGQEEPIKSASEGTTAEY